MNLYEKSLIKELNKWHNNMIKQPSYVSKVSKTIQTKTQSLVPDKVQKMITKSIKTMVETIMYGSSIITDTKDVGQLSLAESDYLVEQAYKNYNKLAVSQGVGFGAGGIVLGLADFPALLTLKVKFLFDCAKLYGYDLDDQNERLYLLYIFQLAFSSDEQRIRIYNIIINWEKKNPEDIKINWEKFQTEYRDYIDIAKMLQLLPVVGAAFGGVANYRLLDKLKVTAMNCYRMRHISHNNIIN